MAILQHTLKIIAKLFFHNDLDALLSFFLVKKFLKGYENAVAYEKPADWKGEGIRPPDPEKGFPCDLALDMDCGIKGEIEADGKVHSCSKYLLEKRIPKNVRNILKDLVTFVDAQDSQGPGHKFLAGGEKKLSKLADEIFSLTGINQILRAVQRMSNRDFYFVCDKMYKIFEGMYRNTSSPSQLRDMLSCLILEFTEKYKSEEDRDALAPLLEFTKGYDVYKHHAPEVSGEIREIFAKTGILGVYAGICMISQNEDEIRAEMFLMFEGMYLNGLTIQKNKKLAKKAEYYAEGQIAVADGLPRGSHRFILEDPKVRFLLYTVSSPKWTIGINQGFEEKTIRADHRLFRKVVEASGESIETPDKQGEWFAHHAGFQFNHGGLKAPARGESKVTLDNLLQAAIKILAEEKAEREIPF